MSNTKQQPANLSPEQLTKAAIDELERLEQAATPGPWRWRISRRNKRMEIAANDGHGSIVMDFVRWGMNGATARFRDMVHCLMVNASELAKAFPGQEHNAHWCADIDHPDAQLIVALRNAAPALIAAYRERDALAEENRRLRYENELLRNERLLTDVYSFTEAVGLIAEERLRKIDGKGYTPEHDDQHTDGSLAECAKAILDGGPNPGDEWWEGAAHRICCKHESDRLRQLVIAGAMIVAEIERLQRASPSPAATLPGGTEVQS